MNNFIETNIFFYYFINLILPLIIFIGIILICIRLGAILDLLEDIKKEITKK